MPSDNTALTHLFSYLRTGYDKHVFKNIYSYVAERLAQSRRLKTMAKFPVYSGNYLKEEKSAIKS